MEPDVRRTLAELEGSARVPREQQVETTDVGVPREYVAPEDLDRTMLVASPQSAGRLKPR